MYSFFDAFYLPIYIFCFKAYFIEQIFYMLFVFVIRFLWFKLIRTINEPSTNLRCHSWTLFDVKKFFLFQFMTIRLTFYWISDDGLVWGCGSNKYGQINPASKRQCFYGMTRVPLPENTESVKRVFCASWNSVIFISCKRWWSLDWLSSHFKMFSSSQVIWNKSTSHESPNRFNEYHFFCLFRI